MHFASGESDDEDVCDQYPEGCPIWRLRPPYCYRLDRCPGLERNYRRFMCVTIHPADPSETVEGSVTGEPEGHLVWEPLVESDDEGIVNQPSFSSLTEPEISAQLRPSHPAFRRFGSGAKEAAMKGERDLFGLSINPRILTDSAAQF